MSQPPSSAPDTWIAQLGAFRRQADVVARAVIIAADGPTPRAVGTSLMIADDHHSGRIGRPDFMAAILAEARSLIQRRRTLGHGATPWLRHCVNFKTGPVLGESTGGHIAVLIETFGSTELDLLLRMTSGAVALSRKIESGAGPVPAPPPGHAGIPLTLENGGTVLVERVASAHSPFHVYGTGALAHALVQVLAPLPFKVRWYDSAPNHFPQSVPADVEVGHGHDLVAIASTAEIGAYHAVMTSDHLLDLEIAGALLRRGEFGYLGVIGSRMKADRLRRRLHLEGVAVADLDRLSCPIGLDGLQSKNPAVIAVSIAAEALMTQQHSVALHSRSKA